VLISAITVEAIQQQQRQVIGVQTSVGVVRAEHYVLAAGAWSNELLLLPVRPKKGQILSAVPEGAITMQLGSICARYTSCHAAMVGL